MLNHGGSGQHALGAEVNVQQSQAVVGEHEFTNLAGMFHSSRFQHAARAVPLSPDLDVSRQEPGAHEGGNVRLAGFRSSRRSQTGKNRGDLLALHKSKSESDSEFTGWTVRVPPPKTE